MKKLINGIACISLLLALCLNAQNQTETLSPVLSEDSLPFTIRIDQAPFGLPTGLQSIVKAIYKGQWILLAGRTNGLHGFAPVGNNFPPEFQNRTVYVIDPVTGQSKSRSLDDHSGLSPAVIDSLSATAAEFFQKGSTLYVVGGYVLDSITGEMITKDTLTAIDLKELVKWVEGRKSNLKKAIRQTSDPLLQVTGGVLFQNTDHDPFLLCLGQNFTGLYRDSSDGIYTHQIRQFWINDDGEHLSINPKRSTRILPDYRRRDLNVVPIMRHNKPAYIAYAGVFTLDVGVWTVPITIFPDGSSFEPNPQAPNTFKQAMNQYICPTFGLYSTSSQSMFTVFPGGISFGFFSGGTFQTDPGIPFINQVTTIKIDKHDNFSQHLMNGQYPFIVSTGSNPGNQLLFGASAEFFLRKGIATYHNGVIQLDRITTPTVIGYIVGGIMSTLPETINPLTDSTASPYVFTVTLIPK